MAAVQELNNEREFVEPLITNHLRGLCGITSKTGLVRALKTYYASNAGAAEHKYSAFDSMAISYIVRVGSEEEEYLAFVQKYKELAQGQCQKESLASKHCERNLWLLKPANLNQGRGIELLRTLQDIRRSLAGKRPNSRWVLQKYIERPLLYRDRKFDIRVWVVVTDRVDVRA